MSDEPEIPTPADWVEDADFPIEAFPAADIVRRHIAGMAGVDAKYLPGPDVVTSGEWLREYERPLRDLLTKVRSEALKSQWAKFTAGLMSQKVFVLSRAEDHAAGFIASVHGTLEAAQKAGEALGAHGPWVHPAVKGVLWHSSCPGYEGWEIEEHEVKP